MDLLTQWLVAIALNTVLLGLAWIAPKKLLTPAGLVHAWVLGVVLWGTLGWQGYVVMMFYFLVGSAVTRVGLAQKEAAGIAEKRSGARGPENVWGSALVATLCALAAYTVMGNEGMGNEGAALITSLLILGYVASMSTKLADTTASEIGKAYGKRTFLITTFQPVPRGTEGAVSLEGTLAGVVAAVAIALVAWAVGLITPVGVALCVIAAFIATNLESVIGATLQSNYRWLTNEMVNIVNTFIGAGLAIALGSVLL